MQGCSVRDCELLSYAPLNHLTQLHLTVDSFLERCPGTCLVLCSTPRCKRKHRRRSIRSSVAIACLHSRTLIVLSTSKRSSRRPCGGTLSALLVRPDCIIALRADRRVRDYLADVHTRPAASIYRGRFSALYLTPCNYSQWRRMTSTRVTSFRRVRSASRTSGKYLQWNSLGAGRVFRTDVLPFLRFVALLA